MDNLIIAARYPFGLIAWLLYSGFHFLLRLPAATVVLPITIAYFAVTSNKAEMENSWVGKWPDLGYQDDSKAIWDWVYDPSKSAG